MRQVMCQHRSPGRMPPDEHAIGIAAALADILVNPVDDTRQIVRTGFPGRELRMTLHVDADHAVLHRPQHDVVVEPALRHVLLFVARPTGDEDQHRSQPVGMVGLEYVEGIAGIGAVGDIAHHGDAGVGRLRLQRCI